MSSFAGYLPAEDPKIVVVVMVDSPSKGSRYGGVVAAPAFAEIAEQSMLYLGIQPTVMADEAVQPIKTVQQSPKPALLMSWEPPGGWSLPDFSGRTMRDVLGSLNGTGLAVDIAGSGRLVSQHPPAGSFLAPGSNVRLEFH